MISTELKNLVDPNNECCCQYHLAHKCKEWSIKNGYGIASSIDGYYPNFIQAFSAVYKMHTPEENIVENQADTEPEAIFKACQWILDNKDK